MRTVISKGFDQASRGGGVTVLPGYRDRVYPAAKCTIVAKALQEALPEQANRTLVRRHASSHRPAHVSVDDILQLYRHAAARTRFPFAYKTGLQFHVSTFGMYGFAILSSTDFRQALRFALRYHQLATPLAELSFEEKSPLAAWKVVPLPDPAVTVELYRFLVELQFGIIVSLHRDVMGASFAPVAIDLTYPAIGSPQGYARAFGCPVRFERPANTLTFEAAILGHRPRLGDATTYAELLALCDQRLAELKVRVGFAGRVRAALLKEIARPLDAAHTARELHVSTRTLGRRLHEQGLTLRGLQSELKEHLAIQYLRDTRLHFDEVASLLGFAEPASLRKAFVRWTHTTPARFRRRFVKFGKARAGPPPA